MGYYLLTSLLPGGDVSLRKWDLLLIQQRSPCSAGGASQSRDGESTAQRQGWLTKGNFLSCLSQLGRRPDKSSHSSLAGTGSASPHSSPENSLPDRTCLHSLGSGTSPFSLPVSWPFVGLFKAWGAFCITGNLGSEQLAW